MRRELGARSMMSGLLAAALLAASLPVAVAAGDSVTVAETRSAKIARCIQQANRELQGTGRTIKRSQFDKIVLGGPGPDDLRLDASSGRDLICGFAGNDVAFDGVHGALSSPSAKLKKGDVFVGGAGADRVGEVHGGAFVGGAGNDVVLIVRWGIYVGGSGNDWAERVDGGRYFGSDGNDVAFVVSGGMFRAGPGDDGADTVAGGSVLGGGGIDEVSNVEPGAVFRGGAGADHVDNVRGIFWGGGGGDDVRHVHAGGKYYGQRGPDLGDSVAGLFNGGKGNDHVCDLSLPGRYYGAAGIDKLDVAEAGAKWFSVERRVACPY